VTFGEDYRFELGKGMCSGRARTSRSSRADRWVGIALDAAEDLAKAGIKARVINMSSIKPLDEKMVVQAAKECGASSPPRNTASSGDWERGLGGAERAVADARGAHRRAGRLRRIRDARRAL